MQNNFTIQEVRDFWDKTAKIYDGVNENIGGPHYQRFTESLKYLDLQPGQKVLNIWSRTGNAISYLRRTENLDIYNLEVSPQMVARAKEKFPMENFVLTDFKKIDFSDNFFDAILSLETLEHVPEPKNFLKELHRVLKPGGKLVMSLPPKTAEWPLKIYELFFNNHGEGPHKFLPSKKVKEMLRETGFDVRLHKGTLLFPAGPIYLQNLAEKIIENLQWTPIKELGIRQFYVSEKKMFASGVRREKVALSFDLEYWHCGTFLKKYLLENLKEDAEYYLEMSKRVLELLKKQNSQATFFVLGKIIKENPDLIGEILMAGQEVGYHGFKHRPLNEIKLEEFKQDLQEGRKLMKDNWGQDFKGFRAPNFSLKKEMVAFWQALEENGFVYDSSLIGKQDDKINKIKEIPVSSCKILNYNLPLGGWYFRVLPYWLFRLILKNKIKKGQRPIIYLHMMDLWPEAPAIRLPFLIKIIKYWGIKKAWQKLERLLKEFQTVKIMSNE